MRRDGTPSQNYGFAGSQEALFLFFVHDDLLTQKEVSGGEFCSHAWFT